jgi:hypothetical protein
LEGRERDLKVDDIFCSGLDCIVAEYGVLADWLVSTIRPAGFPVHFTIDKTLESVSTCSIWPYSPTHAHTWVPCSGMIVKRTSLLFNRTQATGPSDAREVTNSVYFVTSLISANGMGPDISYC